METSGLTSGVGHELLRDCVAPSVRARMNEEVSSILTSRTPILALSSNG